jgi:ribonuclease E
MMPGMSSKGVSRKIEDEVERRRLRQILDQLDPPDDCGFIIRTAGVGKSKAEIERDLKYLTRLFETINKKAKSTSGPIELYAEGDLVTRTVRDVMTSKVETLAPEAPLAELVRVLGEGKVGVVVEKGVLFGLVTRIDLVNYLRRRAAAG